MVVAVICLELLKYLVSVQMIIIASCFEVVMAAFAVFSLFSKEKRVKIVSAVLLAFALINLVPNIVIGFNQNNFSAQPQYVIHAGGKVKGDKSYLNCEEPLIKFLAQGQNLVELDFMFTSDNRIVCTHRFEHTPYGYKNRPTADEFLSCNIDGYTAMSFERLLEVMENYPQAKIVFDTKESKSSNIIAAMCAQAQNRNFDIFSRFIIQVYSLNDYNEVKASFPQFKEFWFTNYKSNYPFKKMIKMFEDKKDVTTLVICKEGWCSYALCMLKTDKKIAVHTENSAACKKFYFRGGVNYVYTDYV